MPKIPEDDPRIVASSLHFYTTIWDHFCAQAYPELQVFVEQWDLISVSERLEPSPSRCSRALLKMLLICSDISVPPSFPKIDEPVRLEGVDGAFQISQFQLFFSCISLAALNPEVRRMSVDLPLARICHQAVQEMQSKLANQEALTEEDELDHRLMNCAVSAFYFFADDLEEEHRPALEKLASYWKGLLYGMA
ncbi:MAG: hypothetical protein KC910_12445 [Candidatus Eremiobacteraeota bacterium]|nr:hypothetical protein [Candidatus Eremiobacteraeota bacterium]